MAENEKDKRKLEIIWDAGRLWYSTFVEQIAAVIRGLIVPGLLGPAHYGILGGLNLIVQYGQYADLGVTNGMYRELPMYRGKGDEETASGITRSAFSFNFITTVVPAVLLVSAAFIFKGRIRNASFWGLIAFAVVFFLYRFTVYFQTYLKAIIDFKSTGRSIALRGVATLAAVVTLTYLYGIYGLYAGLIAAGVAVCAYLWTKARIRPALIPEVKYLKELLRVGVPYFVVNLVGYLMISIDRVVVFNLMPKSDMGYYTLAAVITSFVFSVPMNVGQVLGPQVFGVPRDGDRTGFRTYLLKPTVLMTIFSSLLGGAAILLLIPFIRYALPDYWTSMQLVPPMFVAFTVLNGTHGSGLILIALHRFRALTIANGLTAAFIGLTSWLVITQGFGLMWVAIAAAGGITGYALFLQLAAWRVLRLPAAAAFSAVIYLFLPPALMATALFIAFFGSNLVLAPITPSPVTVGWDLLYLGLRLFIYAFTAGILLYYAERRTGVVGLVLMYLRSRFVNTK
jgi:O-antigen/teichoic acid export membrane protein